MKGERKVVIRNKLRDGMVGVGAYTFVEGNRKMKVIK